VPDDVTIGVDDPVLDDAALEALAEAHAAPPPAGLRARVLGEARREAGLQRLVQRRSSALARWRLTGALAAGIALALGGLLVRASRLEETRTAEVAALALQNQQLATRLEEQGRTLAGLHEALAAQVQVLRVLAGPRTLTAALAPSAGRSGSGRVLVDPASGESAVVLAGLSPAPTGTVYELWAIRGDRPPEPAGLFTAGDEGAVAARGARIERPAEVTAFAVSIEPAGGSTAPTGPIVLAGAVAS
jgi:anti-sigma-K factor RskA